MLRIILAILCAAFVAITPTLAIPNQAYGWSGLKTEQALISAGESANLSWSIDSADAPVKVSLAPGIGTVANSGSIVVKPAETTTYVLTVESYNTDMGVLLAATYELTITVVQ
ncbi:MAG: hypothetical protein NT082_02540 [Chloroflexi bacterium]|nr:hypothetical protein [Chloroflexota bacterium]